MLPIWSFQALNINGHSGGVALGYNSRSIILYNIWGGIGHIGEINFSSELDINIRLINVYGPCQNRGNFWEHLLSYNQLQMENPILRGDLNFSIGYFESWGHHAQINPLSTFFKNILEEHSLIDIPSRKLKPT